MVHDTCEHGALSQAAEEGLHALEEPCAAFTCNLPAQVIADTLVCTAAELEEAMAHHGEGGGHKHDDDDHDHSPTKAPTTAGATDSGSNTLAVGSMMVSVTMIIAALSL